MSLWRTMLVALRALRRNPTRALLTALGIVIGIAAVIAMMEIGNGSSTAIRRSIENMGANSILVIPGAPRIPGGVRQSAGSAISLVPEDCDAIMRDCPSVAVAVPIVRASSVQVVVGNKNWTPQQCYGTDPDYLTIRNWKVADGRNFTAREVSSRTRVCLVGKKIVTELFDGKSPVNSEIRINNVTFEVIGVLQEKGANMMGFDEDDVILAPWSTIRLRITGLRKGSASNTKSTPSTSPSALYPATGVAFYPEQADNLEADTLLAPRFARIDQIMLMATDPKKVDNAVNEVTMVLRERHNLKPGQEDDFWIRNSAAFMETLNKTGSLMTNLLMVVALISLVVGGVGIMNIMLVSVTERTREIGLRMAVGARSRDILKQFLVESIMLCLVGGIVGIVLGRTAAVLVRSQLNWPIEPSPGGMLTAVAVSAAVGIVFGFYPAWKASRLDPIEALRYE
ncbi:MAG: Macrolide export ATP-binding/permease protein MacB [Lentisphaerae bacterium ADurb.Bin242]|nr:MAG: Macrolide export ATP-binding/permease protein MacB [Lentisphaerae bacterium ADurb.Bin242]